MPSGSRCGGSRRRFRREAQRLELGQALVGHRLPDPKREPVALGDSLEDPRRPEPAVLVVDCDDSAARGDTQSFPRRLEELVLGGIAKRARNCHADSSRRIPVGSSASSCSTTPPSTCEIAICACERGRVEPDRVVVLRAEERRRVARDRVERRLRRLLCHSAERQPVSANPAALARMRAHKLERLFEPGCTLEPHIALRERPGGEVDVRVGEPGEDAASAEVDDVRARGAPSRASRHRPRPGCRRSRAPARSAATDPSCGRRRSRGSCRRLYRREEGE